MLGGQQSHIFIQTITGGTKIPSTVLLELRSTGSTKDLNDVRDTQVGKPTLLGVIDLCPLDDNHSGRSEGLVKEEHTDLSVDTKEVRNVHKVRQCGGKTNDSDHGLRRLDLSQCSGHQCLNNRTTVFM
ncbi:hypothetical protein WICPIJ_009918 [Wickerhamomyces pijperi]|uniref:Uncharacterized protein n=1 Tax=Wickerhamomyces pijperi TaxID=599730 RepID=A0A9P8PKK3_WICPI|nr:hypothetical protein WICPIJ_009918 [Wickerhamomyces pijperi]